MGTTPVFTGHVLRTELVIRAKNPVTERLEEGSTHRNYLAAIYDVGDPWDPQCHLVGVEVMWRLREYPMIIDWKLLE